MNYLTIILLSFLLMGASECQKGNSTSGDFVLGAGITGTQNQTLINLTVQAQAILTAKCIRCHGGSWSKYYNDVTKWANTGGNLIVPGDGSDNSNLINRTNNCGGGTVGPVFNASMPTDGNNVTDAECTTLKAWITELQNI